MVETEYYLKRIFDFVASFIGILILLPVYIVISILIKLNDNGPVFFRQKRIGRGGVPFYIYKFRTLKTAGSTVEGLFGPEISKDRLTSTGKILRKTKLNELPQLFNVLKGDMSFVGPRPEVERWIGVYPERWARILSVRPGITSAASIYYWNEEYILASSEDPEKTYREVILPKKLDISEYYIDNYSFFTDLKLIFITLSRFVLKDKTSGKKFVRSMVEQEILVLDN